MHQRTMHRRSPLGRPRGGRALPVVASLLAAALLLGACGGGSAGTGANGGKAGGGAASAPVELTVIAGWAGAEQSQFMPVLKEAEKKLGIKITYRIYRAEDLANVLPPQFQAQQAPGDVIFMWDWWVKQNHQYAEDLTDIWQPQASQFTVPAAEVDGRVYALPYDMNVKPGFWYRKSFFEKNGLQPPKTWDEFLALLEKISKIPGVRKPIVSGDGTGWPLTDETEHFLITFGGPELQKDLIAGRVKWTAPRVRDIFQSRLIPVLQYSSAPIEWTQAIDLWWNGQYALYFMGNWITGMVKDPNDLGFFPLPGAKGIVGATDYLFVPKYGAHVAEAKKLAAFLISREGQALRVRQGGGKLSPRRDVPLDQAPAVDRMVAEQIKGMEILPDLDDSIGGDWQRLFWDQLKLLWVQPSSLDRVLRTLEQAREQQSTSGK
ncbi:MAG: ABC transporter substrate-binding protein [Bacillota bacterium]|nr:ABC transporter substrate-binding protein [Bacillota bacterium]